MKNADLLLKLQKVEENAWMLFAELPHCAARNRALHVYLDAKDLKQRVAKLEPLAEVIDLALVPATGSRR